MATEPADTEWLRLCVDHTMQDFVSFLNERW